MLSNIQKKQCTHEKCPLISYSLYLEQFPLPLLPFSAYLLFLIFVSSLLFVSNLCPNTLPVSSVPVIDFHILQSSLLSVFLWSLISPFVKLITFKARDRRLAQQTNTLHANFYYGNEFDQNLCSYGLTCLNLSESSALVWRSVPCFERGHS